MTLSTKNQQALETDANCLSRALVKGLRLKESNVSSVHNLVWWDPGFRATARLPDEEQSMVNISYASSRGINVGDLAKLRKTNFLVYRDGRLREKATLDAPTEIFWEDTQQRQKKLLEREQGNNMAR